METLVEHKLKHIYFFSPYIPGPLPADKLQSLPIFSDVPQHAFKSRVCTLRSHCCPGFVPPQQLTTLF